MNTKYYVPLRENKATGYMWYDVSSISLDREQCERWNKVYEAKHASFYKDHPLVKVTEVTLVDSNINIPLTQPNL